MRETLGDETRSGDLAVTGSLSANSVSTTEDLLADAVLWLDAAYSGGGQTVRNLGRGGRVLDAQNGSTSGADSNDARFLDWPGDNAGNYVYLPGVSGNYLSVPDEAALDITGDIDIRLRVALDDWTPASSMSLICKSLGTGDQRSFRWLISNTGVMSLTFSSDGLTGTEQTLTATQAVSAADGDAIWVRVTLDVNNGSGGCDANFFTSIDGSSWSAVGSAVSGTASSIFASSAAVNVGAFNNGANNPLAAKIYRAQVLDGIDGTTVLDVDTSVISSGSATSFTAVTGQTVTINRSTSGRKSVAVVSPVWLFGTDDYMEVSDNDLLNFGASDSFTVLAIFRDWDVSATSSVVVAKKTSGSLGEGWYLRRVNDETVQLTIDDGTVQRSSNKPSIADGEFVVAAGVRDTAADNLDMYANNTAASSVTDTTTGTLANSEVLRIGRLSGAGTAYVNLEFIAAAVFDRALTAAEITSISSYYESRVA